jgi:hypothetical protein
MLVILTLLALTGTNTARTELVMAQNEQFRKNATLAASAGLERAIGRLGTVPAVDGADPTVVGPLEFVAGGAERFTTSSRYIGTEANLPSSSVDSFVGLHYEIDSNATSVREARDAQRQGVMVIASGGSPGDNIGQLGTGLP